ncbi:MAG TPA: (4Fe-4S)-binding protein [Methanosarcinales archaeon]|nr:(4Fe-4S)-binding protein [Methanosarcinales archaeon]
MIISIASGKGGTGKTTLATNLALALQRVQLLDCDVEEPNAYIFLKSEIKETKPVNIKVPKINNNCNFCGLCSKFCAFNALAVIINQVMVFPELCHGCGGCSLVCPKNAILEIDREIGVVKKAILKDIELVYGELNIGEPRADPVIKAVKKEIKNIGDKKVIIDAPPGTSCPVITSVYGSDYCILVTEPTPFGLHDLKLAVEMLREIKIPCGVVINRAGIGDDKVYKYCNTEGIPILLEIPYSRKIAELYSRGIPFVQAMTDWKSKFISLFKAIKI